MNSRSVLLGVAAALAATGAACAEEAAPFAYDTVAAVREALRQDPTATSQTQQGWTVVASRENGAAVEWFFTPEGYAVYPAVVKRTVSGQALFLVSFYRVRQGQLLAALAVTPIRDSGSLRAFLMGLNGPVG